MLFWHRLSQFIHIHIILTNMMTFIRKHWKKVFYLFLSLILFFALFQIRKHSIVIGNPRNIIVVSPEQSQDVIVIGDPSKITVKSKK